MVELSADSINKLKKMLFTRRFICSISQLCVGLKNSPKTLLFPVLQTPSNSCCECRKTFQSSAKNLKDNRPFSQSSKFECTSKVSTPIVLDVEEEREKIEQEEIEDQFEGINLQRGVSGVFDIKEIVELLQRENVQNIFVVRILPEVNYADYMVIATGRSKRHMLAVFSFIKKVFKKKMSSSDIIPRIEGITSSDWMAVDLGNIVVHMFSKQAREIYDLESLWSLGREYDPHSQKNALSENQVLSNYESLLAEIIPENAK